MKNKLFTKYPEGNIVTKCFDIFDNGVILDLITDQGIFYMEFDKNHKCTNICKII